MASVTITRVEQDEYTRNAVIYGTITADDAADENTIDHVRFRTATSGWVTLTVDTLDSDYLLTTPGSGPFQFPVTFLNSQSIRLEVLS